MDNKDQDAGQDPRKECEIPNTRLAFEISKRKQAEARAKDLAEELAATNDKLISYTKNMEDHIRFDMLLSEISTHFINLPPDQVDSEIEDVQRRICECLGIDMSTLWQWTVENPDELLLTHFYRAFDGPPIPRRMRASQNFPWSFQQVLAGRMFAISSMDNVPAEAVSQVESWRYYGIKATVCIPIIVGSGRPFGAITFQDMQAERAWSDTILKRLQLVTQIFANALERKRMDGKLLERLREIVELKQHLEDENIYLQEEVKFLLEHKEIVGQSLAMKKVLSQAQQVGSTDSTVLIQGETGSGKELLARAIHQMSGRKDRPMVTVNCASLPPTLIESELFGREKGAYTGALTKMAGRFEVADESTLFLDEIGELPFELQSKLLKVLEDGRFERLGSAKSLQVNVRIIAATNRDLSEEVKTGKFRKDLYYRLNVFPIPIPPLRERPEDIPLLVWFFVREYQKKIGKRIDTIPKRNMETLQSYAWPGNVRELRNVIERAIILSSGGILNISIPSISNETASSDRSLEDVERKCILKALEKTAWRMSGKNGAAAILGLKRTTLQGKMKKLGIQRPLR
jgi:formate hydrogenlyase transcriptional activator